MSDQTAYLKPARTRVAEGLERVGLAGPAYRFLEWTRSLEALPETLRKDGRTGPDGLPLPPPALRVKVTHTARAGEFIRQGERAASTVREGVRRGGRELEDLASVLDFGCGCGRVTRHWASVPGPSFYGSDYNSDLVDWCSANLRFGTFRVNQLTPPLPFDDGQFDLVYALSVFTHLTEQLQHEWIAEMARVIQPGGLLLFTTRGETWRFKLTSTEVERYDSGELVTRYGGVEGTNLCAAWHPWSYVDQRLARSGFRTVDHIPAGLEDGLQDVHVLERTA